MSLTIEFFRINASDCTDDKSGIPVSFDAMKFSYGNTCELTCSIIQGPFSPLRRGSANKV